MKPLYLVTSNAAEEKVKVDRYPDISLHNTTIEISTANYVGSVIIEASLMLNPTEQDWFVIVDKSFLEISSSDAKIRNEIINLQSNYVWMRAKIIKNPNHQHGIVDRVMVI